VAGRPAAGRPLNDREPGLFGPGSVTWRLDREAFLLLGAGPRALLLQIAHPAVAAGVADHSSFREDPWGRLAATLRSYLRIVYGTSRQAKAEIRRLDALHARVRGTVPGDGRYDARDPELALWVHATLVDSTLVTADAWLAPLTRDERAAAYLESLPVGRAFGIPDDLLPPDLDAFEAYVARMLGPAGPVLPGPLARELADTILHPPLGPAVRMLIEALPDDDGRAALVGLANVAERIPSPAISWLLWPSIGLLPAAIRDAYELRWGPLERAVAAWLGAGWRAWNPRLPASIRWMPQALAADRRMAAG